MYVCLCNGITESDVREAGRAGHVTPCALKAKFKLKESGCCGPLRKEYWRARRDCDSGISDFLPPRNRPIILFSVSASCESPSAITELRCPVKTVNRFFVDHPATQGTSDYRRCFSGKELSG